MLGDVDVTGVTGPGCWVVSMIRGGHWTSMLSHVDDTRGHWTRMLSHVDDTGVTGPRC